MFSSTRILRWALLGAATAALILTTAALGGSGVGGVFNLGQTNTVNGSSKLTGSSIGPQLYVTNTNTGSNPAIRGDSASTAVGTSSIYGLLSSTTPGSASAAVRGVNKGTGSAGYGVYGSQAGSGIGVYGKTPSGTGVYGVGAAAGVQGQSSSVTGAGVVGRNTAGGPGLRVVVSSSAVPPLAVNSTAKVMNFNADALDGLDSGRFWKLGGNTGVVPGLDYLGTSDSQPLDLRVNGASALRIYPNMVSGAPDAPNLIGGAPANGDPSASGGVGMTIAGGGDAFDANQVTDNYGTVGGGFDNTAGDLNADPGTAEQATVGGGAGNQADALSATVGGGDNNTAGPGQRSTVAGGDNNTASGFESAIAGGAGNTASGNESFVAGGTGNTASGNLSFAAGRRAKANQAGSFVWGDSTNADVTSLAPNTFTVRASGGTYIQGSENINGGALSTGFGTFASGATTPSVSAGNLFLTANTNATTITDFTGENLGQTITILFGDDHTTVQNNSTTFLKGGVDFTGSTHDTLTLVAAQGNWYEVSRSVNH